MPQLQSLHLHIQALVLTEPDSDSSTYQFGPLCFTPHAQWLLPPHALLPLLGAGRCATVPWKFCPALTLPFPEYLALPAKFLLDIRPGDGPELVLWVCSFAIQKMGRVFYWGPHPSISVQSLGSVPASPWDQKQPRAVTASRVGACT